MMNRSIPKFSLIMSGFGGAAMIGGRKGRSLIFGSSSSYELLLEGVGVTEDSSSMGWG